MDRNNFYLANHTHQVGDWSTHTNTTTSRRIIRERERNYDGSSVVGETIRGEEEHKAKQHHRPDVSLAAVLFDVLC